MVVNVQGEPVVRGFGCGPLGGTRESNLFLGS